MIYFSKQTNGFYVTEIHGEEMPPDAIEITEEEHKHLLDSQANGFRIVGDETGNPTLEAQPVEQQVSQIKP